MDENQFISRLYRYSHSFQALKASRKASDTLGSFLSPEPDDMGISNRDERVAVMTLTPGTIHLSPVIPTIKTSRPASPTLFGTDSECSDDDSNSPRSSTGEECPDLCGGPKGSCRSWTPPASPFYYTDERGIFLLDDRENYEERQKIELEHTLHDLDERLQRLRESVSPPRFLSRRPVDENATPLSSSDKSHGPSAKFPRSSTGGLAEHSRVTATSPQSRSYFCDINLRRCKLSPAQSASPDLPHRTTNAQKKDGIGTTDLGKLIRTSLQHVQYTNSPPRYLAHVSATEAHPSFREPIALPNSHEGLPEEAPSMRHTSPQLHFGTTAYPTPLPSSPESKPSRKRGRDEGFRERSGRKRRREEGEEWISAAV